MLSNICRGSSTGGHWLSNVCRGSTTGGHWLSISSQGLNINRMIVDISSVHNGGTDRHWLCVHYSVLVDSRRRKSLWEGTWEKENIKSRYQCRDSTGRQGHVYSILSKQTVLQVTIGLPTDFTVP